MPPSVHSERTGEEPTEEAIDDDYGDEVKES
jgi:hypothetical protein